MRPLERLPPSIDESATSLGCSWFGVLRRIHLPLLKGPMLVGSLLVFVDVVIGAAVDPLGCAPSTIDTLAVRVSRYATTNGWGRPMGPALISMVARLGSASWPGAEPWKAPQPGTRSNVSLSQSGPIRKASDLADCRQGPR